MAINYKYFNYEIFCSQFQRIFTARVLKCETSVWIYMLWEILDWKMSLEKYPNEKYALKNVH